MSTHKQQSRKPPLVLAMLDVPHADASLFEQLSHGRVAEKSVENMVTTSSRWQRFIALPAYYWVLISVCVVVLPHFNDMPVWLVIYALFSVIMQLPKLKAKFQRLKRSYRIMQMVAFSIGVFALWYSFKSISVDSGVGFLLLCLASKLWEMYQRRDAYVVLNLSLFVCAALLLVDQGLSNTLFALVAMFSVIMAFIVMNDDDNQDGSGRVRSLGLLLSLAVPLLIVLFLFFPRLPPLWSLKLASNQAKTGMSDSMSPGDFAKLSQSTELAFRVEFDDIKPPRQDLYWRGMVFDDFNGKTWSLNPKWLASWNYNQRSPQWLDKAMQTSGSSYVDYQVTLEPTHQQWLFALDYPIRIEKDIQLTPNFTLKHSNPISQQYRYKSTYEPNLKIDMELTSIQRKINLALPATGNERSKALAKQLYSQASSVEGYVNKVNEWINKGQFRYTLEPPMLNNNRIDEFLFNSKAGFCEHYSSSFTYLMRAAGVPARVVVGYQGGELGRDGKSWEIRQMDAHAWSEVWIAGKGWVRFDPTSFVAPERIENGMDQMTSVQGSEMFGKGLTAQISYQQFKMLQEMRRLSDQVSYYWQKDVVGYDQESQHKSLLKWFKIKSFYQQILFMIVIGAVLFTIIIVWLWFKRRQTWHLADKKLMKLSHTISKINPSLGKQEDEGMIAWLDRLKDFTVTIKGIGKCQKNEMIAEIDEVQSNYRLVRYSKLNRHETDSDVYQDQLTKLNKSISLLTVTTVINKITHY